MGKRGGTKKVPETQARSQDRITLREEITGRKQSRGGGILGGSTNFKSVLKNKHLQNLAVWASQEASIPSLAAFFGRGLAADGEAVGIAPDHSLFACQRCETILKPGFNCTTRIEKNTKKARQRRKKSNTTSTQNNVVYKCHFCSHQNLLRGTPKGHMKGIYPTEHKPPSLSKFTPRKCVTTQENAREDYTSVEETPLLLLPEDTPTKQSPATPLSLGLLDGSKRKRNRSGSKSRAEPEISSAGTEAEKSGCASSKRKRKSWTSLKEIVEHNGKTNFPSIINLKPPFRL